MKRLSLFLAFALVLLLMTPAVMAQDDEEGEGEEISVWVHSGQSEERTAFDDLVDRYNTEQNEYMAVREVVPEGSYNDQVQAAALAGDLPCVLDFDGPFVYNYVFAGDLAPLDPYVDDEYLSDFLPSIIDQGTVDGQLWSLGQFDSGIAFYANREMLEEAGVRIPEGVDDPWTLEELNAAVEALAGVVPEDGRVVEFYMNRTGEWYSYAFGPILRSFGGDTIDKETFETAEGVLNGPEAFEFGTWLQGLFTEGYATATPVDPETDFQEGRVALAYDGHWNYNPYKDALGDNLVVIPMPDFGEGPVSGMGSWNWGITSDCENKDGAWDFIEFLLQPENIAEVTEANGAPASRISVLEEDERYAEGGDLYVYTLQLQEGIAVPRAATAAYPGIQTAMSDLINALARGEDVQEALDAAVDTVDAAIETLE